MICNNCKSINVCKIYDFVKQYQTTAVIDIKDCQCYSGNVGTSTVTESVSTNSSLTLDERMDALKQFKDEDSKNKDTFPDNQVCEICGGNGPFVHCDNCGKVLCLNCAVEDPLTHKTLCEECQEITSDISLNLLVK